MDMLTKTDLSQVAKLFNKQNKEIKKLIREEVESEGKNLNTSLRAEIKLTRMEIQNEIRDFASRIKNLEIANNKIQKQLGRIEKKLDKAIDFLDREHLRLQQRVEKIEKHLGLPPLSP